MSIVCFESDTFRDPAFWPDIYFTPEYGRAEQKRSGGHWMSLCSRDGRWQMPLVRQPLDGDRWDAATPYGYAGIYMADDLEPTLAAEHASDAVSFLANRGCVSVFVRRSPIVRQGRLPMPQVSVVTNHPVQLVPLNSADSMWSALTGRARTAIRKAEKSGFRAHVRALELDELESSDSPFRSLYDDTMRRVGATSQYHFTDSYYHALQQALRQQLNVAEVLNRSDSVVSAALLMTHERTQHYHLSGSDPAAARLGANNLLLWTAMTEGAIKGYRRFLLGGGLSGEDSLYNFKKSFGGRQLTYAADGYIIDSDEYERRSQLVTNDAPNDKPVNTPLFFPAYRRA